MVETREATVVAKTVVDSPEVTPVVALVVTDTHMMHLAQEHA
jgi:hypothetical protein